jgi:hypothetical protein
MRPSSAFFVYCTLCHVQAELRVWRKTEKVESFRGWNFRGLYGSFCIWYCLDDSPWEHMTVQWKVKIYVTTP